MKKCSLLGVVLLSFGCAVFAGCIAEESVDSGHQNKYDEVFEPAFDRYRFEVKGTVKSSVVPTPTDYYGRLCLYLGEFAESCTDVRILNGEFHAVIEGTSEVSFNKVYQKAELFLKIKNGVFQVHPSQGTEEYVATNIRDYFHPTTALITQTSVVTIDGYGVDSSFFNNTLNKIFIYEVSLGGLHFPTHPQSKEEHLNQATALCNTIGFGLPVAIETQDILASQEYPHVLDIDNNKNIFEKSIYSTGSYTAFKTLLCARVNLGEAWHQNTQGTYHNLLVSFGNRVELTAPTIKESSILALDIKEVSESTLTHREKAMVSVERTKKLCALAGFAGPVGAILEFSNVVPDYVYEIDSKGNVLHRRIPVGVDTTHANHKTVYCTRSESQVGQASERLDDYFISDAWTKIEEPSYLGVPYFAITSTEAFAGGNEYMAALERNANALCENLTGHFTSKVIAQLAWGSSSEKLMKLDSDGNLTQVSGSNGVGFKTLFCKVK